MKVPFIVKQILLILKEPFLESHIANICGHKTPQKGFMINGHTPNTIIMEMPLTENGHPDYCLKCIGSMSIRCAWCGKPIVIGSPITLYALKKKIKMPKYAVSYPLDGLKTYVGCVSCYLGETGIYSSGYWLPGPDGKGEVKLHLSLYEQLRNLGEDLKDIPAATLDGKGRIEPKLFPLSCND